MIVGRPKNGEDKDSPFRNFGRADVSPDALLERAAGKAPPHDLDAEAAVLSACLMAFGAILDAISFLRPEHFYSEAHRRIFEACLELQRAGQPVDVVTVGTWLKNHERIAQVGGMQYLTEVLNAAPAFAEKHLVSYAHTIREKFLVRRLIAECQKISAVGYIDYGDTATYLSRAEATISEIAGDAVQRGAVSLGETLTEVWQDVTHRATHHIPPGIKTGFDELDDRTLGVHGGEVTLVGARPGMGKTAFGLCLTMNIACSPPPLLEDDGQQGIASAVAFYSAEMRRSRLGMRILASEAKVQLQRLRRAALSSEDWTKLSETAARLASAEVHIDDTPGIHVLELTARTRRLKAELLRRPVGRKRRLRAVIVDYIQLLKGRFPGQGMTRNEEIGFIMKELVSLAKEEELAVIALAQLSRETDRRGAGAHRPQIADLRESGDLEQDAANIWFLYRPEYYGEKVPDDQHGLTEIIVAKQREGPTGTATARYFPQIVRFDNA